MFLRSVWGGVCPIFVWKASLSVKTERFPSVHCGAPVLGASFPRLFHSLAPSFTHTRSVSAQISNHDSLRISLTVFICQNSFLDSYSQNSASPHTQEAVGTDGRRSVSAAVGPLGNYQQVISAASVISFAVHCSATSAPVPGEFCFAASCEGFSPQGECPVAKEGVGGTCDS